MLTDIQLATFNYLSIALPVLRNGNVNDPDRARYLRDLSLVANVACALYLQLAATGNAPRFSNEMLSNRLSSSNATPNDPEFYRNFAAIEDFLGGLAVISQQN